MKCPERLNGIDVIKFVKQLRGGETPVCPKCGKGVVSTSYDPKVSHFFSCNRCDFMINID